MVITAHGAELAFPFLGCGSSIPAASFLAGVSAPTLALVAGAPASGHKHYSPLAAGGRAKPCIFVTLVS